MGVLLLAIVSGGALLLPHLQRRGNKVSTLQATQLMNQNKAVIVDVRDAEEFKAGSLRGARNIPLKDLPNRMSELDKFKNKTAIVVCQNGIASGKAAAQFKKAGFEQAAALDGGIAAWQSQGLPLAKQ